MRTREIGESRGSNGSAHVTYGLNDMIAGDYLRKRGKGKTAGFEGSRLTMLVSRTTSVAMAK